MLVATLSPKGGEGCGELIFMVRRNSGQHSHDRPYVLRVSNVSSRRAAA
jgi:hypothetical protein